MCHQYDQSSFGIIIEEFVDQSDEVNMKQRKLVYVVVCMCVSARENDVDRMNENDGGSVGVVCASPSSTSSSSLPFFLSFLLPNDSNRT